MKRFLLIFAFAVFSASFASAQSDFSKGTVYDLEYESFTSVSVSDDFIVKLVSSSRYMTRIVADKRLEPYVKTYVQNGTLHVSLDRKSFTPELKKSLRAKGASAPILEVEISFPTIKMLKMSDNAILHRSDIVSSDAFKLNLTDKARVDKLYLDCTTAELNLDKSSYADVESVVDEKLFIFTANSSKVVVNQKGKGVKIDASGSSMVDARIEAENLEIASSGTSMTKLISGKVGSIEVNAAGSSKVDVESVSIAKGKMNQEGSAKCYVDVTDTLKVNLVGNSMLTFKNKPYIDVERILGSTLIKADDPKRK